MRQVRNWLVNQVFYLLLICSCLPVAQAGETQSAQFFGSNPALTDGARALQMGNYEAGLRLTAEGLDTAQSLRQKASAYSNLCAALVGLQRYADAIENCDKALELNDRNWRIYNNRALALLGAGQVTAAREALEKGLDLKPDSVTLAKVAELIAARSAEQVVSQSDKADTHYPQSLVISDCDPAC